MRIGLLVTIFLLLLLHSPKNSSTKDEQSREESYTAQQSRSKKTKYAYPHPVNIERPEGTQIHRDSNIQQERSKADPPKNWWIERINAGSTVIIALFAGIAAFLACVQIKNARDSVRSWMLVNKIGNPNPDWIHGGGHGETPCVWLRFKVFGETPVILEDIRFAVEFIRVKPHTSPPQPDLPTIPNYGGIPPDTALINDNRTLPPKAILDIRRNVHRSALTKDNLSQVRKWDLLMCAYGRLNYTDVFGRKKETRCCYVYDLESPSANRDGMDSPGFRKAGTDAYNKAT